jgi:hypothetical protein
MLARLIVAVVVLTTAVPSRVGEVLLADQPGDVRQRYPSGRLPPG